MYGLQRLLTHLLCPLEGHGDLASRLIMGGGGCMAYRGY